MPLSYDKTPVGNLLVFCCIVVLVGFAVLFVYPGLALPYGLCGPDDIPLTVTTDIEPSFETSYLYDFNESEPDPRQHLSPLLHYPLRKEAIDALMKKEHIAAAEDAIIGIYELASFRIVLIDEGTGVIEILETIEGTRTFILEKRPVGILHADIHGVIPATDSGDLSPPEWTVTIHRIDIVLPGLEHETAPMYIVKKTRRTQGISQDRTPLVTVSTTGTFYVIYGQRVELVVRDSEIVPGNGWTICHERFSMTPESDTIAELKHTIKLARGPERELVVHVIRTGPYIQRHDGHHASSSQWMSRDSIGCSC
jgi:hypothetical protein